MLLGRPWIHENKVVPSSYFQCLKYLEGSVEKKIVVDDKPFTETESHFVDAKFYLKNYMVREVKVDDIATTKSDKIATERADETIGKVEVGAEVSHSSPNKGNTVSLKKKKTTPVLCYVPKLKKREGQPSEAQENTLGGLTFPIRRIDAINLSSKLLGDFVAQNPPQNMALPTKCTNEGFDPNAYKLFVKAGYNPNKPSKLGKLPSEASMIQSREGLGYKQPPPVRISIRRASINYITVEDESVTSNKRPSVFDRLGKSATKASVFERLGPLKLKKKRKNKFHRDYQSVKTLALPGTQRDIQMYTKERDEDEESIGSLYYITAQSDQDTSFQIEVAEKLEDIFSCYHISFNDRDPREDEDARDAPPELEEGVKTTVDSLKEVNLGTDEDPRPTYLSAFLTGDEEDTYMEILKEYRDVFAWSYKEIPGLDPKVAVHHLAVKNGARPVKQAQRYFRPDLVPSIENEVNKLIEAGFIREVKYPTWISSIVPVKKKTGQIRVCVDFRDLNNACPKDDFPLPIPELMIDATTGYEAMSFMDG
ncbi:uncharacterized protein LOC132637344 [Lycium barbarum]|uniref:uncharacterized protein LOC132637344 n=1 Tax=Lycium barbarum TaxID=112863 RepID=UPI00293E83DF|nr:uncharacterized protein LOC132637344 [Lycium barbarum]